MGYTYEKQYSLIEAGDYEAIIDNIEVKTYTSGAESLSLTFKINPDVDQKCKGRIIFENIWKEKDHKEFFNRTRINQLLGTQKNIKEGQVFDTIDDIIAFLKGARLVINIGTQHSDYKGEDENVVKYYKSSNYQPKTLGASEPVKVVDDITNLDDLPF